MQFNPNVWPTHAKGEAVRQQMLTLLDIPRTKKDLALIVGKSPRQVERHLSRLVQESKVRVTQEGKFVRQITLDMVTEFVEVSA